MQPHALVIDDDPEILEDVKDRLESLGHTCDTAGCQTTARECLRAGTYSYILLDLQIPVRYGRKTMVDNGMHLLEEIRQMRGLEHVPVIVLTTHGLDSPDLAVSALKKGAVDYVKKTFDRDELSKAIREALAKSKRGEVPARDAGAKDSPKKLIPFKAARREMLIYPDRITVCGIEVWKDCAQPDLRRALEFLSRKDRDGFVRIRSTKLDEILGRDNSNPISRRVKDFRDRASKVLAKEGYECGPLDILAGGHGGYRFTEWMDVRVVGSQAHEPAEVRREPAHEPDEPPCAPGDEPLNERQQWILAQVDKGERLRIKDIVRGTEKNRSTVNRDLKDLRRRGLIALHGDGHYVRSEGAAGKGVTPSVARAGPRG